MQTHPFYIDKHPGSISLDGEWRFGFTDEQTCEPDLKYTCTLPASGFKNLEQAGLYPNPYFGLNSKLYADVDKHIYYYKREFDLPDSFGKDVYLCFEGVSYTCRVWLNGKLICEHEGMFGGPVCEVGQFVKTGRNELLVEVVPPVPESDPKKQSQIVPWNIRRDDATSNGDFIVFGIWRPVRIEIVPKYHLSRPHIYTVSIDDNRATLKFEAEIADPQIKELEVLPNDTGARSVYTFDVSEGFDLRPTGKSVTYRLRLVEKSTQKVAYSSEETVEIYDKKYLSANNEFRECQFIEQIITLENPRLWQPCTLGAPELYEAQLELVCNGQSIDYLSFDVGIRTVEYARTSGMRSRTRWEEYQYIVNGRKVFLRGMNWMPIDYLYNASDNDYRWVLDLVKNAGIMLLRIWSGGGMPEDDRFYKLCDEYGIMVMQDSFIANQLSDEWNRAVLQSQVCYNLYRIRNHPSLVNHTGGNEINPYAPGNDAAMWVISREIHDLDPSRKLYRTSPDSGSAHIYMDMEPVWYKKYFGLLPFIGESGIHSFPNFKTLCKQISEKEYSSPLSDIFNEEFKEKNPELYNHFTEYAPSRVPRMMSRASMINNIHGISLSELCEATQLASCEFYQIMINAMRENYPVCAGVMPWVFKRHWTTVAIQLVDGLGEPIAPYYYMKNAYAPLSVLLSLDEVSYAPCESFTPTLSLVNSTVRDFEDLCVCFEVYDPEFKLVLSENYTMDISCGEAVQKLALGEVSIPDSWTNTFFFMRAVVSDETGMINQSFYWCKVLESLKDEKVRENFRKAPCDNVFFENGPWLKPQISRIPGGCANIELLNCKTECIGNENFVSLAVRVSNFGDVPLFPVKLDVAQTQTLVYADDNYFFMEKNTTRQINLTVRISDINLKNLTLELSAWNCDKRTIDFEI